MLHTASGQRSLDKSNWEQHAWEKLTLGTTGTFLVVWDIALPLERNAEVDCVCRVRPARRVLDTVERRFRSFQRLEIPRDTIRSSMFTI
jgi:hypothetical protein